MKIKQITFTGADDSINPEDLINISQEFPFVEWGILLSKSSIETPRFPSMKWMDKLNELCDDHSLDEEIMLSGHLCGRWLRDWLIGVNSMPDFPLFSLFKRIQLNFHGGSQKVDEDKFFSILKSGEGKDFIFQIDEKNNELYRSAIQEGVNAYPFFDLSGGAGLLPEKWDTPLDSKYCGYAGGLGPDNLDEQLEKINKIIGDRTIWVDMETKVRSDDNKKFDLDKVRSCISIVKEWIV